jgi:Adaptor complexes medium subunit family
MANMLQEADVCSPHHADQEPVIALDGGAIWPVVVVKHATLFFVVIPVAPRPRVAVLHNREPKAYAAAITSSPGITAAVEFAHVIKNYMTTIGPDYNAVALTKLKTVLNHAVPFGRYLGTSLEDLQLAMQQGKFTTSKTVAQQDLQPCWKPHLLLDRRKTRMQLMIRETIRHVSYGYVRARELKPSSIVSGQLICNAEIAGLPTVQMSLTNASNISNLRIHPCAEHPDPDVGRMIVFRPPLGEFELAAYDTTDPVQLPFLGNFSMKARDDGIVSIEVSFLLEHDIVRPFSQCQLTIPLAQYGLIEQVEQVTITPSWLRMPDFKEVDCIVWQLGEKLPHEKCTLSMNVRFRRESTMLPRPDPFLVHNNSFATLCFTCSGYTLSGVDVATKDVDVKRSSSEQTFRPPSVSISSELRAEFIMWNAHGAVRAMQNHLGAQLHEARQLHEQVHGEPVEQQPPLQALDDIAEAVPSRQLEEAEHEYSKAAQNELQSHMEPAAEIPTESSPAVESQPNWELKHQTGPDGNRAASPLGSTRSNSRSRKDRRQQRQQRRVSDTQPSAHGTPTSQNEPVSAFDNVPQPKSDSKSKPKPKLRPNPKPTPKPEPKPEPEPELEPVLEPSSPESIAGDADIVTLGNLNTDHSSTSSPPAVAQSARRATSNDAHLQDAQTRSAVTSRQNLAPNTRRSPWISDEPLGVLLKPRKTAQRTNFDAIVEDEIAIASRHQPSTEVQALVAAPTQPDVVPSTSTPAESSTSVEVSASLPTGAPTAAASTASSARRSGRGSSRTNRSSKSSALAAFAAQSIEQHQQQQRPDNQSNDQSSSLVPDNVVMQSMVPAQSPAPIMPANSSRSTGRRTGRSTNPSTSRSRSRSGSRSRSRSRSRNRSGSRSGRRSGSRSGRRVKSPSPHTTVSGTNSRASSARVPAASTPISTSEQAVSTDATASTTQPISGSASSRRRRRGGNRKSGGALSMFEALASGQQKLRASETEPAKSKLSMSSPSATVRAPDRPMEVPSEPIPKLPPPDRLTSPTRSVWRAEDDVYGTIATPVTAPSAVVSPPVPRRRQALREAGTAADTNAENVADYTTQPRATTTTSAAQDALAAAFEHKQLNLLERPRRRTTTRSGAYSHRSRSVGAARPSQELDRYRASFGQSNNDNQPPPLLQAMQAAKQVGSPVPNHSPAPRPQQPSARSSSMPRFKIGKGSRHRLAGVAARNRARNTHNQPESGSQRRGRSPTRR